MKLYKIINDQEALVNFINWLPDLQENETYYLSLFSRKKYCQDLIKSNDKTQLKRFTANKHNMLDKIQQLELPIGRWKLREIEAPQESLVLYIMPNPRCMKKATKMIGKHCWDLDRSNNFNLVAEAMSCVQKSKSKSYFVDFDIDNKDVDLKKLDLIFPNNKDFEFYTVLETRGGYHILVSPGAVSSAQNCGLLDKKLNWYKAIKDIYPIDQSADQMIPVPGCTQGNFTPKFITI